LIRRSPIACLVSSSLQCFGLQQRANSFPPTSRCSQFQNEVPKCPAPSPAYHPVNGPPAATATRVDRVWRTPATSVAKPYSTCIESEPPTWSSLTGNACSEKACRAYRTHLLSSILHSATSFRAVVMHFIVIF